jgi:hypothetical protein
MKKVKSIFLEHKIIESINHDRKQQSFSSFCSDIIDRYYAERNENASKYVSMTLEDVVQK